MAARRFHTRGVRRSTAWFGGPSSGIDGAAQATGGPGSLLMTTGAAAGVDGLTLVRTRGELLIRLTAASAISEGFFGAFGIGVVTVAAFTAGAASVPTPVTEETWDGWLYHTYWQCISQSAGVIENSSWYRKTIDSKAMRKLAVDEIIFAVVEFTEVGTSGVSFNFNSRILMKLS